MPSRGKPDSLMSGLIQQRADALARQRESFARQMLEMALPRWMHRLIDHPRLLGWYFRLRPSARPTMYFGAVPCERCGYYCCGHADASL